VLVLVSNREDLTADWLVLELERRGEPFLRLCSEDYPTRIGITWTLDRATLELDTGQLGAADISAVWWRRPVAPVLPAAGRGEQAAWATGEARVAWDAFWGSVEAHWVNLPAANARADRKPLQLREAGRLGLNVPATLITNDTPAAQAFAESNGPIVCKALYNGLVPGLDGERALYTQPLSAGAFDDLGELGPEPYLLQALVKKTADIRVTVIGEQVFACGIDSQTSSQTAIDWRQGVADDLPHDPVELDEATTRRLLDLTAAFDLRFAAIDLALDRDGRYVFFEINPNGQWAWIEQLTGQPLSAALADELLLAR
jgi:MvdD pre-ATP grasp domain/RimK-like ATP-grasp domain